jgi:putative SOS response-associated peptidase YedK
MCGRFTLRTPLRQVADAFELAPTVVVGDEWRSRYNIAPTQQVFVVRESPGSGERELVPLHWGLIPRWADDPAIGGRMINARSETLAEKPAFREAFHKRRCLIVADGFYEWRQGAKPKQPYYIHLKQDGPFAFAGLWEHWKHGELAIDSCTIVTTEANELLRPLHDRMPVILPPKDYARWLDEDLQEPEELTPLLKSFPAEAMTMHPVSTAVNSARREGPELIATSEPLKTQGTLFD